MIVRVIRPGAVTGLWQLAVPDADLVSVPADLLLPIQEASGRNTELGNTWSERSRYASECVNGSPHAWVCMRQCVSQSTHTHTHRQAAWGILRGE